MKFDVDSTDEIQELLIEGVLNPVEQSRSPYHLSLEVRHQAHVLIPVDVAAHYINTTVSDASLM